MQIVQVETEMLMPIQMDVFKVNSLPLLTLDHGEAHVWFAFPLEITDPYILDAYHGLMSDDERKKHKRYYFKEDRHNCLIARALVRSVLSRYLDIPPEKWQFSKGKHGKPEIKYRNKHLPIRFNLSHTDGLVGCVVTLHSDTGIDVENIKNRNINLRVADRFFSPLEVKDLRSLPESHRRKKFLDYWTLKESYVKARGKGLSIPLDEFSFIFTDNRPAKILFNTDIDDQPDNWQFCRMTPSDTHKAALAIRKNELPKFKLTVKKIVPLVSEELFCCDLC